MVCDSLLIFELVPCLCDTLVIWGHVDLGDFNLGYLDRSGLDPIPREPHKPILWFSSG